MNISLIPEAGGSFHVDAFLYAPLGRTYTLQIWREETEGAAFVLSNHSLTPTISYPGIGVKHVAANIPFATLPFSAQFHLFINGIQDVESSGHDVQMFFQQNITNTTTGYIPQHRNAQYLIRDFTKLNGIQKSAGGTYRVWDIDFISTQALSMAQAANKCRELVAAATADPTFSLQYRTRALSNEEWTAQRDATFNQAMSEIAQVIDFAVDEVQNKQKFNLVNPQLLKVVG
jgi:hypothetical protein